MLLGEDEPLVVNEKPKKHQKTETKSIEQKMINRAARMETAKQVVGQVMRAHAKHWKACTCVDLRQQDEEKEKELVESLDHLTIHT